MDKVLWAVVVCALLGVGSLITVITIAQNKLATESIKREALITEQELYLADVWAEKEDYKQQLGIFIKPKGGN